MYQRTDPSEAAFIDLVVSNDDLPVHSKHYKRSLSGQIRLANKNKDLKRGTPQRTSWNTKKLSDRDLKMSTFDKKSVSFNLRA